MLTLARRAVRRWAGVQARNYTSAREALLVQAAGGSPAAGDAAATAVLEACAGLLGRSLASARVEGSDAVTPAVLEMIGREVVSAGEVVFVLDTSAGKVKLLPVGHWDVTGGPRPESWWYRCNIYGPSGNATDVLPSSGVVHCTWSVDPAFPWRGIGPLQRATSTSRLLGRLTESVGAEGGVPVGALVPVPDLGQDDGSDDGDDAMAELRADLGNLRGRLALVPTTAGGFGSRTEAPRQDWNPTRVGPNPPASLAGLIDSGAREIMAACGVPVGVLIKSEGSSLREEYRRYVHSTVQPLGRRVAAELSAKLEADVRFDFGPLHASDIAGRARAFAALVGSGMELALARDVAGLDELTE